MGAADAYTDALEQDRPVDDEGPHLRHTAIGDASRQSALAECFAGFPLPPLSPRPSHPLRRSRRSVERRGFDMRRCSEKAREQMQKAKSMPREIKKGRRCTFSICVIANHLARCHCEVKLVLVQSWFWSKELVQCTAGTNGASR